MIQYHILVDFLSWHPDETILLRFQENSAGPDGENPDFIDMVEDDLNPYSDWIWQPTNVNPMLGEVRGKIVILEHFSRVGEPVDHGSENDVGMYSSLALDYLDNPHISYYDANTDDLKYTFLDNDSGWVYESVETEGNIGQYTSLALSKALDADGNPYPHISYYDATNSNLKYAYKQTNGGWWLAPIDGGSDYKVGQYTSIALDADDNPHISYYDESNKNLKYAYKQTNGGWWLAPIDGGSDYNVGQYTSIALDADDNPHISYYDATNDDLKYAFKDSVGWHIETVDSVGDVGQYSSIALDDYNQPHISYYDNKEHNLKYAYGTNWSEEWGWDWQIQKVDHGSENDVGMYSSLALDDLDNPHISYYDNITDDLRYAFMDNNSDWVFHVGETGGTEKVKGNVGLYTSLSLDENNHPRVSYYDATNGDLLYAGLTSFCGDGVSAITQFGLKDKLPCFKEKELWSMKWKFEVVTDKWPLVKEQLIEAEAGARDRFYLNGLNGTATGELSYWDSPFPWFVASGHAHNGTDSNRAQTDENCTNGIPDNPKYLDFPCNDSGDKMLYEGTNELTLNYLNANPPDWLPKRWGFIVMDFPGADLIDAIISSNFPPLKAVFLPNIVR